MSDIEPGSGELDGANANPAQQSAADTPEQPVNSGLEQQTNQWSMFIHFSILAGWFIPLGGLVLPIILWQLKKDDLPGTVPHSYVVLNWIISSFIYAAICLFLTLIVIGVFGFILLGVVTVIYSIIGGVKANNGELWEYPGTIVKVFKV